MKLAETKLTGAELIGLSDLLKPMYMGESLTCDTATALPDGANDTRKRIATSVTVVSSLELDSQTFGYARGGNANHSAGNIYQRPAQAVLNQWLGETYGKSEEGNIGNAPTQAPSMECANGVWVPVGTVTAPFQPSQDATYNDFDGKTLAVTVLACSRGLLSSYTVTVTDCVGRVFETDATNLKGLVQA